MRIKSLLIGIAFMFSLMAVHGQEQMFEKFSSNNDISTVYISKALLSMAGNMDMGGANIKGLAGKLEKLEIYTSESKDAVKVMKEETGKLAKDKSFEVLMQVKDKGEFVTFYGKKISGDKFKDLIMHVEEPNECTIIRIVGTFTMDDIQGVINDKK